MKITALPLRAFAKGEVYPERLQGSRRAPLREPLAPSRRAARPDLSRAKTRRRKEGRAIGGCEITSSWPSCLRVNQIHASPHTQAGLLTHTKTQRPQNTPEKTPGQSKDQPGVSHPHGLGRYRPSTSTNREPIVKYSLSPSASSAAALRSGFSMSLSGSGRGSRMRALPSDAAILTSSADFSVA